MTQGTTRDPSVADMSPIAHRARRRRRRRGACDTARDDTHTHTKNTIARDFAFEMSTSDAGGGRMRICTRATITESVGHQENTRKYVACPRHGRGGQSYPLFFVCVRRHRRRRLLTTVLTTTRGTARHRRRTRSRDARLERVRSRAHGYVRIRSRVKKESRA